jgi:hypothetical protein
MGAVGDKSARPAVDAESSIVRILAADGSTAGTGFVVAAREQDGVAVIATCAHVVEAAGSRPCGRVRVVFRRSSGWAEAEQEATVDANCWRGSEREDVAFLRCPLGLLPEAPCLPIGSTEGTTAGDVFETFGFPLSKPIEGLPGKVEITGRTTERGCTVLSLRSNEVSFGFSGAPTWDREFGVAIGMVVSVIPAGFDPAGKQSEVAFVIPAETLVAACPALRVSPTCPYRGLEVFGEEHAHCYFGREAATRALIERIESRNFVAVVGVSGSGKSSLIRAGLKKGLDDSQGEWLSSIPRCRFRPGTRPMLDLVLALEQHGLINSISLISALGSSDEILTTEQGRREVADQFEARSPAELARSIADRLRATGALLIADQFEQLFTECGHDDRRQHFIDVLLELAEGDVKVLVALRADFYGQALQYSPLAHAFERGQVNLLPMSKDELLCAIRDPAVGAGVSVQPKLRDALVADVVGRAGDLPLLEFSLTELWNRDAERRVLTAVTYERIGRLQGALRDYAERVWRTLDAAVEQSAAQRVFLTLVSSASTGDDALVLDASRRAWPRVELGDSVYVADKLVDARLLTSGRDSATGNETVELAHEALLRAWPRLRTWVLDAHEYIRWYDRDLGPYLRRWIEAERSPDFLLPAPLLDQARRWLEEREAMLSGPPSAYIRASLQAWEDEQRAVRRARRSRSLAAGMSIGLVIAILLALLALQQRSQAVSNQKLAQSLVLASYASQNVSSDPALSTVLALRALAIRLTAQATLALRSAVAASGPAFRVATGAANAAAFSPDARTIVTAGVDGAARIWDIATHREVGPPFAGGASGTSLPDATFSPDGRMLVTASADGTVRIWDVATHRVLAVLAGHTDAVTAATFSPDGRLLVTASADRTARIWDVATHRVLAVLAGHTDAVTAATFSPDGRLLVTASADRTARIWDVATHRVLAVLTHSAPVLSAAFSPDARTLVTTSSDGTARIWTPLGAPLVSLPGLYAKAAFAPGPAGATIPVVTVQLNGTVRILGAPVNAFIASLQRLEHVAEGLVRGRSLTPIERRTYLLGIGG